MTLSSRLALALTAALAVAACGKPPAETAKVTAAEYADLKTLMGEIDVLQYDLIDALDAGSGPKAQAAAEQIEGALKTAHGFWLRSGLSDVVAASEAAIARAGALAAAAREGRLEAAAEAFGEVQVDCVACHELQAEPRLGLPPAEPET